MYYYNNKNWAVDYHLINHNWVQYIFQFYSKKCNTVINNFAVQFGMKLPQSKLKLPLTGNYDIVIIIVIITI
jgi:hypothetical protein